MAAFLKMPFPEVTPVPVTPELATADCLMMPVAVLIRVSEPPEPWVAPVEVMAPVPVVRPA